VFWNAFRRAGRFAYCSKVKLAAYPPTAARSPKLKMSITMRGRINMNTNHIVVGINKAAVSQWFGLLSSFFNI
jgi:hypothetical protein